MTSFKEMLQYPENSNLNIVADYSSTLLIPWHSHQEYELIYVVENYGKKFVGDSVNEFSAGDLTLIGRNLPHSYLNTSFHLTRDPASGPRSIVLQFPVDFFSESQLQREELSAVRNLLINTDRGLTFSFKDSVIAGDMLIKLYNSNGMERLLLFLKLMDFLGNSDFTHLASHDYLLQTKDSMEIRLSKALQFITRNFMGKISLADVAGFVRMNPSAFSRYFSQQTGTTFSTYLTDLRINHSCTLLKYSTFSINEIAAESGFANLSNYNRHFKKLIGESPTKYRSL